jgi:hypothetical protein
MELAQFLMSGCTYKANPSGLRSLLHYSCHHVIPLIHRSHITRDGSMLLNRVLPKSAWLKTQVRPTEMVSKTRKKSLNPHARIPQILTLPERAWFGLKLAIKDIKVPIFMIMACSQLLGFSFVNFFPT